MRHEPCYYCLEATPIQELDGNGCCWNCSPENPYRVSSSTSEDSGENTTEELED